MKILIPNGPGIKNLGDLAIYESLVSQLKQKRYQIIAHRFDPKPEKGVVVRPNIYYWGVFQDRNLFIRFTRMILLFIALFLPSGFEPILPRELKLILSDYKKSDKIILKGGGYFRSKPGLTQQINAVMNCVFLLFAKKYKKEITIRPMSFGPFSNKVTERICAKGVNLADKIYIRDKISYKLLKKYISQEKLFVKEDEAFLREPIKVTKNTDKTLGFTIREWAEKSEREAFLNNMATLIKQAAHDKGCIEILPIIQVDAPEYNEGDEIIIKDISSILRERGMKVGKPLKPKSVSEALKIYGKLSYLVGMRMHSCIFAHIQEVPFTVIAYEHKHSSLEKFADEIVSFETLQGYSKKN